MDQLSCMNLFPTAVFATRFTDAPAFNATLLERIAARRALDPGIKGSNPLGWHSRDDLFTLPEFAELAARVAAVVLQVARAVGYGDVRVRPMNAWATANPRHAAHVAHDHPNALFSGVYYARVPEPRAGITFHDPRPAKVFYSPRVASNTLHTTEAVTYPVEAGTLLVFPAWLRHGTEPNLADDERIAVSFNYGFDP